MKVVGQVIKSCEACEVNYLYLHFRMANRSDSLMLQCFYVYNISTVKR